MNKLFLKPWQISYHYNSLAIWHDLYLLNSYNLIAYVKEESYVDKKYFKYFIFETGVQRAIQSVAEGKSKVEEYLINAGYKILTEKQANLL